MLYSVIPRMGIIFCSTLGRLVNREGIFWNILLYSVIFCMGRIFCNTLGRLVNRVGIFWNILLYFVIFCMSGIFCSRLGRSVGRALQRWGVKRVPTLPTTFNATLHNSALRSTTFQIQQPQTPHCALLHNRTTSNLRNSTIPTTTQRFFWETALQNTFVTTDQCVQHSINQKCSPLVYCS